MEWFEQVELFCEAVEKLDSVSGMVRLHPSDRIERYKAIIDRYSRVCFIENHRATLDESIMSSDVVVVQGSGVGGDALVKRRPVVVLIYNAKPTSYATELIQCAACPHARTSDELSEILHKILNDESFRRQLALNAETYVEKFCHIFGEESARLTADLVRKIVKCPQSQRAHVDNNNMVMP